MNLSANHRTRADRFSKGKTALRDPGDTRTADRRPYSVLQSRILEYELFLHPYSFYFCDLTKHLRSKVIFRGTLASDSQGLTNSIAQKLATNSESTHASICGPNREIKRIRLPNEETALRGPKISLFQIILSCYCFISLYSQTKDLFIRVIPEQKRNHSAWI